MDLATQRGRPKGKMTPAASRALDYVVRKQLRNEPVILGEMMRQCGFSCRSNAKRTLYRLKLMGMIN